MFYLAAERWQEAETTIITRTTSRIRLVINRGSVCVCDVCVHRKSFKVVQRGGNTLAGKRDYRRERETLLLLPIKHLNPQREAFILSL